uniref:Uncharacterized protein LOC111123938 isoform X5 n=1 Tax=Crassostrea virginica TaxID=6565 RepID=A0A8B8D2L1_CRAVI|nr:uncharacterized protein LOC111123938 isoform X5 [Crassostrea virginica]
MLKFFIILVFQVVPIRCACTLPTSWDGQWWDSGTGDVTFVHSSQTLTGWRLQVYTSVITDWTCVNQNSTSHLLFRANQPLDVFGQDFTVYRCLRIVKVTDYSYYYYIFADEQQQSGNIRYDSQLAANSPSEAMSSRCQPSSGAPSGEEYHVLIKKGFESHVKQWCPIPLLGTFSYTHDTGSVVTCGAGSVVSACPEWTELNFNYSQCATTQVFSASGRVQCVATVEHNGTIYTTVFNAETVTDTTNYDKFTCLALTVVDGTLYVSDAKGSCVKDQTSTVKASRGSGTLVLTPYSRCYGGCDFPEEWDSLWYDSNHGEISINRNDSAVSSGWSLPVFGTDVTSWTCFAQNTTSNYLLFKGDQIPLWSGIRHNVFRCVRWERSTRYSYSYYVLADINANATDNRVFIEAQNVSVTSWTTETYCQEPAALPVEEFNMIVKKGHEADVKHWCPVLLLGNFTYSHQNGSLTSCGALNSDLSACPSWTTMTFNYAMCNTMQGFSAEGVLYCLKYVLQGSTIFLSVLNPGVVDATTTHRFTCYAISEIGDSVFMSDSKGSCEAGQTPTTKAVDGSGTLQLTPKERCYGFCSFPPTWDGPWHDSGMGDITLSYTIHSVTSGWRLNVNETEMKSWTCQSQNTTDGTMLFRADDFLTVNGKLYNVFRCIKAAQLTNFSYSYYVMNDIMTDTYPAQRGLITEYSPDVTDWDVTSFCLPTSPPEENEYHILVKQGFAEEAKQWCPIPLRGSFNYTHDSGLGTSCGASSLLSLCPDWVTLRFNYTLCPTVQTFSKEGLVQCVHTVVRGDTYYTTVMNPGLVDDISYRRFTCLAITAVGDTLKVSDSPGSCRPNQTSSVKQTGGSGVLTLTMQESCYGSCSLPSPWIGDWYDSFYGQLTFSGTTLTGWQVQAYATTITSWTCVSEDTTNNYLLFLADQKVDLFSTQQNMFRCIRWKKITDNSFYYYARSDAEVNAGNARVKVEIHNAAVTSWSTASYCNPSAGPGPEEYHVLIKKGSESLTKQWCPVPLLGTFNYVHNDGATQSCVTDSEMTVCPSWTSIQYDYTKCTKPQAFSQEGSVFCVNTVVNGDTFYTALYNPGVVDDNLYHRFTCYAISELGSGFYISDSPGICEAGQVSSTKATDGSGVLTLNRTYSCHGQCDFPATWTGLWYDSGLGNVTLDKDMHRVSPGWTFNVHGTTMKSWTCQSQSNATNTMLFKSDQFVEIGSTKYNVFRCIKFTRLTDYSYMYYVQNDVETNAGSQRVLVETYDPTVNSWDPATYCNPTSGPGQEEYHVMVKAGYTNEVKQWCPVPLLGKFTYQHNDGSTVTCTSSSDVRVCPDWTTMAFNYSLCATTQAFSQDGVVHCLHTVTVGSTYYLTVLNPGPVDDSLYHRFTCYALSLSGSVVLMSDSAGSCQAGQPSNVKQADGSGTLTMTSYESCHGSCTLPVDWNGAWLDSEKDSLSFEPAANRIASGWSISAFNNTVSAWTCHNDNATQNYLLFKADDLMDISGTKYNVFRCIKWKKLSPDSYRYYIMEDMNVGANGDRVRIELYDPTVTTWSIETYCSPNAAPDSEEYNVIVRQGKEGEVKQWCPIPLLGTFTYTHNDGTTVSCAGNSLLNVCNAWTTMIYDYSKCSKVQAFSSEGVVYCVDTVKKGSVYYTTVINPGSVDNVATKRFACYSISESGNQLYMSDSAGGCHKDQTPIVKQTDGSGTLTLSKQSSCYGTSCSLPNDFVSDWYDSGKGNFSFVNSSVSGWDLTAYGDQVSSWTCQDNRDGLYLFKGDNFLDTSTGYKNALLCIDVKKLTNYSYQYYVKADTEPNTSNKRVYVEAHNSSVMTWNTSDYCTPTPGVEEYHVIVRKGYEQSVKQWCPIPLLGAFTYNHTDGATTTCSGNSGLSVCPSWTTMKFDYMKCSTVQAFSSEGTVDCIHSTTDGTNFYTTVLNPGVVDNSNFYRFTCYAISASGDSVYLSDSHGMCEAGQAPTVKQSDGSGTLTLTSIDNCYGSCTLPVDWDGKWYDSGNGNISFDNATSSVSSGWSPTVLGKTLKSWTCLTSNSTANFLLFRADSFVEESGVPQNVFKCIRWERITDHSYIYRIMADKLGSGDRLHVEPYDSSVTSWSTDTYCNPTTPPGTGEFHTLVKEGQESAVKQWCPGPLRGAFSYSHNDGASVTCSASSDLSVCPDWTILTFDYSQCTTIQAFSQEGKVSCVYTTMVGSTYFTSVLNPGVVDSLTYNRFTCYAIGESGGQVVMSDSAGSCAEGMSTSTKSSTGSGILTLTLKDSCFGTCHFPNTWDSEWYDSDNQEIIFNLTKRTVESGWTVTVYGSSITSWTCQSNTTDTNSLLFLADQQVDVSGTKYNVFKCIRYERVTDFSYKYYIYNDREPSAGNLRLALSRYDPSVTSFNMSVLCNTSSPPTDEEFHMLVKKGYENDVGQWCPTSFIGAFHYKHNTGSVVTCNTASNLDVCTNWTTLAFDYNQCPTIQAFSAEGKVECIYTQSTGSVFYVSVFNKGTVDYTSYQRFTCLAVEDTGSLLRVSDSAGSCNAGQTPTVKQVDGSGTLEISLKESCHGNCSLPSAWDSAWLDSGHGQLVFNQSEGRIMSGWSVNVYGTSVSSWTCHASNSSSSSDSGVSLFKADKIVSYNGKKYNIFRCIEWKKITSFSYFYYVKQDENVQTNNERYLLEEHNPFVTSWDLTTYCSPTTPPPVEEYHVLVKEGQESDVKQWCPVPLRARFSYTHNDGSALTCGGGSSLSLCPDWSILTFDYSLCSTEQAFSKEGIVYCVNSVFDGTEFHTTVINPGNVSQSNYHRFSCYTVKQEGSTIYMSDSAGSCNKGQEAKTKQNDGSGTITLSSNASCYGACSFPPLWEGEWYDSLHGDITLNASMSTVAGWVYDAYNQPVTPFTCVSENSTSNQLLFIGDQQINLFSSTFNVFVCIQWRKITDYSYLFYVIGDVEPNINGNRRAKVELNDPSKTIFSTADYCKATIGPGVEEYNVLVKKGFESSVVQWCPTPLLGRFTYIHNDGTTSSCASSSELHVCPTWTRMTFDYTKCATKQAFSNEGVVDCIETIEKDGTYFTTVFNNGSVDNANFYRFSCLAVSVSGNVVYISDSKGSCQANQTSTSKQNDGSGTLVLTKQESCYGNCNFPSTWESGWYDSSMGNVTMSNSSKAIMSGWSVTAYGVPVTTWTCVTENTTNNIMLFKGDQVVEDSSGIKKNVFRCIQWKKITDESYFYYIKHDINTNANNMRVGLGSYDPFVVSFDISTYCSPTSSPGLEEYHMLVKQGAGPGIQQWCPNAFLGKFSYIHNTGSVQTCTSSSELSTCSDWRRMIFDYTKCSTIQAFSAEGRVHCVNTIQSGSTFYTSLFNPGTVDEASYFRFTCFAFTVSSTSIRVSDSKGSCQMNQSPTNKATDGSGTIVFTQNQNCYGSCSMPSTWDGKWYDSGLGDIVFSHTSHSLDGWTMSVHGQPITSWTGQTQDNADNLLLFKADQVIEVNGVKKNVFRCIKWTNITNNSFYYYVQNDIDSNAGNQRVKIEDHDPSVQSWNISDYCNPSSAPVIEEYHVIVAEGHESSAKQWCPIPLLGNFTYTHNDGSATSCTSASGLSLCPTWNTLTFDYTKCATEQIFSKEGVGYCVQTIAKGTTFFTTVLNPGNVTGAGHHRFTCLAITVSGNQVQISDSAGSCEAGQTATVKASDGSGLLTLSSVASCLGLCSLPSNWDGDWYHSGKTDVVISGRTKSITSGWDVTVSSTPLTTWSCVTSNDTDSYLLFKSDQIVDHNGTSYIALRCIQWTKITDYSYMYYPMTDREPLASNARIKLEEYDPAKLLWDASDYCSPTDPPETEKFHILVKKGKETQAKQWCPSPLLARFTYKHVTANGTETCTGVSSLDVCTNRTTMTFDYTKCSTTQAFSSEGILFCVKTLVANGVYYTMVLNPGSVDNNFYYRFTCLATTKSGNVVYTSDRPLKCAKNQSSIAVAQGGSGTLEMSPEETCDFTTKVDESKPSDGVATGSIIGAVVGILLILIIGVIIGCIAYKYLKRKKTRHDDTERKKPISDDDTPRALHLNVDDMKKNFALPPLQHASPSMSRVAPMIQKPEIPPPSHLPPVPLNPSTQAKQKKKKKHKKERKEKHNDGSHYEQSNGNVSKPDVISGTSAIELEEDYYGEGSLYTPRELPSLSYAPASTSFIIDRALSLDQGEDVPTPPQPRFYKRQY